MPRFSQKYGYTSADKAFQRERIDQPLRIALWNVLNKTFWEFWQPHDSYAGWLGASERINAMSEMLWEQHFRKDRDELPVSYNSRSNRAYEFFKKHFMEAKWYEVFDFLEAYLKIFGADDKELASTVCDWLNSILESDNSAYRIVGGEIVEITSSTEIQAIQNALNHTTDPVQEHIAAALSKLSDRKAPDYRNSIKESISAVEAECRALTGNPAATLGEAIKRIPNLHPALKDGFLKIYGFTSDKSGIRHALTDVSTPSYAEAKFMLSACSAFVSYLSQTAGAKTTGHS